MSLAVVGLGLVSPAGLSSAEHVFFLRAGMPPPQASPFVLADGEALDVAWCPWMGAGGTAAERMVRLGLGALYEATASLAGRPELQRAPLLLCTPHARPGFSDADRAEVERALGGRLPGSTVSGARGAAGIFATLREAEAQITSGRARAVVLLATDSWIAPDALAHWVTRPPSPWSLPRPRPAEAGAALVVMDVADARRQGHAILAVIHGAAIAPGTSTDGDDAPVDGVGMTRVLRALPDAGRLGAVYGQLRSDGLRSSEWMLALARDADRFDHEHEVGCPEVEIGSVGAAAGAVSLVYGIAVLRHDATERAEARRAPMLAWAISADGIRGAAVATGGGA